MHRLSTRFQIGAALTLLILASIFVVALAPAGTAADEAQRFRVERFAAVAVPFDDSAGLDQNQFSGFDPTMGLALATQFEGLVTFDTSFDRESLREVQTLGEVEQHFPHDLLTPNYLPSGYSATSARHAVGDAGTASVTLDVARVQALATLLGIRVTGLPDPNAHPEVTFTLIVPESALIAYEAGGGKILIGQIESPVLEVPNEVDVERLREDILTLPFLPAETVAQVRAIENWQETLIIPVPDDARTTERVINGADALVIELDKGNCVLWQRDGILYLVGGDVSVDELVQVAESMQ
jgi:hypothetical protein